MARKDLITFEHFYRKFHPPLLAFASYLLRSEEDALEVVNDVFLNIWDKSDDLILDDSLKPYLFRSVRNRVINHQKKKKMNLSLLEDDESFSVPAEIMDRLEDEDNLIKLELLLDQLPPKCRQVFTMVRFDGLSYRDVAELMDISVKTVENQMGKALKFFRNNLNPG